MEQHMQSPLYCIPLVSVNKSGNSILFRLKLNYNAVGFVEIAVYSEIGKQQEFFRIARQHIDLKMTKPVMFFCFLAASLNFRHFRDHRLG